ncbi:hypothetical protein L7F22_028546 [Adiantum nelumboides]|nr:hypothetical protein [Adiantum nelumboides]
MASGERQSNPSTSGDAGGYHNEDYGDEYGPPLPTQEELREMEHRRLEEAYEQALERFIDAASMDFQADLAYNKALCLYFLKQYVEALKVLSEIIDHGVQDYPELSVGSQMEGMELCSVGNSQALNSSKLVEAFNLKAAIEYVTGNIEAAKFALKDMPPRNEEELDLVMLHLMFLKLKIEP